MSLSLFAKTMPRYDTTGLRAGLKADRIYITQKAGFQHSPTASEDNVYDYRNTPL